MRTLRIIGLATLIFSFIGCNKETTTPPPLGPSIMEYKFVEDRDLNDVFGKVTVPVLYRSEGELAGATFIFYNEGSRETIILPAAFSTAEPMVDASVKTASVELKEGQLAYLSTWSVSYVTEKNPAQVSLGKLRTECPKVMYFDVNNTSTVQDGKSWVTAFSRIDKVEETYPVYQTQQTGRPNAYYLFKEGTYQATNKLALKGGKQNIYGSIAKSERGMNVSNLTEEVSTFFDGKSQGKDVIFSKGKDISVKGIYFKDIKCAIEADSQVAVDLTKCVFDNCGRDYRGAVFVSNDNPGGHGRPSEDMPLIINDCVFKNNQMLKASASESYGITFVSNTVFENNITQFAGGAFRGGRTEMTNCTFKNNYAELGGGAIMLRARLYLKGCVFTNNTCNSTQGGAISIYTASDYHDLGGNSYTGNSEGVIYTEKWDASQPDVQFIKRYND